MTYIPNLNGFADYNDALTTVTPIVLTANTWTDITNDGLGSFTNLNSLPFGVTQLPLKLTIVY